MSEQRAPTGVPAFELRHRLARALEEAGVSNEEMAQEIGRGVTADLRVVQQLLGHVRLATTADSYLAPVSLDTMRDAMEGRGYAEAA